MINMKGFLLIAVLLLMVTPIFAIPQDVSAVCSSNNTLTFSISSVRCINGVCKIIENNSTVACQYGCSANAVPNECSPAPSQVNILFYFGAVVFIIFMLGVYKYLKSR